MRTAVALAFVLAGVGCGPKRPPPSFAPDPGLVEQIREIRMSTRTSACPGESFQAAYTAVLSDGSIVPFETRYDKDHPPRLHVVFLDRTSPEATPLESGGWHTWGDALPTALTGFRLNAALRAKPSVSTQAVVTPDYSCLQHSFGFRGNDAGASGPQVTVRLGILQSPFYDRLIVAGIAVEEAPPFYVLADGRAVPPSDWLVVESRGATGARGTKGQDGSRGAPGAAGCPGGQGGRGEDGGNGGPGGFGGRGGQIVIIAPTEEPFLAGLVDARVPGGEGGPGGNGGKAGAGGSGGAASDPSRDGCTPGPGGPAGRAGLKGQDGGDGPPGNRPQVVTVPMRDLWGTHLPPALVDLINYRPPAPARR